MASTDTRSGFRLPWSSDRTQDDTAPQDVAEGAATEAAPAQAQPAAAWPEGDLTARAGFATARQRPADASPPEETRPVISEPPAAPPRKPSKLMADLAAAIRSTAEAARDQRLGQIEAEANGIIELIRAQSNEGVVGLRRKSDEDVAAIRDWAKAEIARIKEESDSRVADRKRLLDQEIEDHAAAIEDRCAAVQSTVVGYREAMEAYFGRLTAEEDPARLATMAETMPEPPSLEGLSDLTDLAIDGAAARRLAAEEAALAAVARAEVAEAPDDTPSGDADGADAVGQDAGHPADAPAGDADDAGDGAEDSATATHGAEGEIEVSEARIASALGFGGDDQAGGDVARWASGETPEGFPEPTPGGEPVDRGAIMAALEAAAEAVVAAEAAAESAETAEAAAGVAETAAELVAGRSGGHDDAADPEAQAALSARIEAGGLDTESYQERLASIRPESPAGESRDETRATQIVVTGLVSVASIASFKRHLGRLAGVNSVAVSSGPDGEFIFNVSHRPEVSFRDAIPTMPSFAARVVATGEGVISVTAHDPESEG